MRSQTVLRSWRNWHFDRDILQKWQLLDILHDTLLEAAARFREQLLNNFRWTTRSHQVIPVVDPTVEKLLPKTRRSPEQRPMTDALQLPSFHFLMFRAKYLFFNFGVKIQIARIKKKLRENSNETL